MGFCRQEYWTGSLLQRNLLDPGVEPRSPALQADSLPSEPPGHPDHCFSLRLFCLLRDISTSALLLRLLSLPGLYSVPWPLGAHDVPGALQRELTPSHPHVAGEQRREDCVRGRGHGSDGPGLSPTVYQTHV